MHSNRSARIPKVAVLLAVLAVLAAPAVQGTVASSSGPPEGIFDFGAEPLPGQSYTTALFRIRVPAAPNPVRGVYFFIEPYDCDSRYIVQDTHLLGLCAELDFALMGARLDNVQMGSGIGEAVLRALDAFAGMSGRRELAQSALFLEGYSWGGQFGYHFTRWIPERVIGFITQKGGYHDSTAAGQAMLVPGYMFIGEMDLPYRITNLTGIFEAHRPLGARWILAMQPGAGHERIADRGLLDPYIRAVAARRLPPVIEPGEPVELLILPEASSWLGDRRSRAIGYWACYDGARDSACWCPSRVTAAGWQAFVSDSAVTDTMPCVPGGVAPGPRLTAAPTLRARPNPSRSTTLLTGTLPPGEPAEITIHGADGRLVRRMTATADEAGAANIAWDGLDRAGRSVAAGVYIARLTLPDGTGIVVPIVRAEAQRAPGR